MRHRIIVYVLMTLTLVCISCGTDSTITTTISEPKDSTVSTTTSPMYEPDKPIDPDTEPIDNAQILNR